MTQNDAVASTVRLNQSADLLAMHDAWPARYPFLLESADGSAHISRYDLLLMAGSDHLALDQNRVVTTTLNSLPTDRGFLEALNAWQSAESVHSEDCPSNQPPFLGGWFLYLGYELAAEIEPKLDLPESDSALPLALAVRCPGAIIRDRQADCCWLIAESAELLGELKCDIDQQLSMPEVQQSVALKSLHEADPEDYLAAVEQIREYILAGDVFQVNLSRGWHAEIDEDISSARIYAQLRQANPAPFAGLMSWQGCTVFSSSPERLVEVNGKRVQTRPIAGTRPRSRQDESDEPERKALVTHPKERAEHIMLIDLERNDLGRICEPGSVEVDELMVLESYTHVHHIVSNVTGTVRDGVSAGDVIRAVFPGGTITGCPKVRCMEIIAELEKTGRGYYTGAMGYLDRRGHMDLNILIRCLERQGSHIGFRTGAGIVADSVAENELQETRAKARGLLRALNAG